VTYDIRGKVAVVTGASSGIGEATARRLATAGMTVVAVARRRERLDALAAEHPGVRAYAADVTDTTAMDELAAWVDRELGACHVLVNNAGIPGGAFRGRDDLDDAIHTIDVNVLGVLRGMAAFADLLQRSAPSRVINVASVAGKLGLGPAAYAASKFAVVGLSEATSFSWARRGITVCQLNPGFHRTERFRQEQISRNPVGRRLVGEADDVARAIHAAILAGDVERTVPRWYRAFVVLRHVAAPVYRGLVARLARAGGTRD
jgi:NAD(P)-dependent dehydrogenase (short-subunit alcohol dehydrogenase family)